MSLQAKLKDQKRKVHSTFKIEFGDGSIEVVDVVHALFSDRQAVYAQAQNAGELDADGKPKVGIEAANFGARIVARLVHQNNQRCFGDSELDAAMSIPGFDDLLTVCMEAFVGSPLGKDDGSEPKDQSESSEPS